MRIFMCVRGVELSVSTRLHGDVLHDQAYEAPCLVGVPENIRGVLAVIVMVYVYAIGRL